MNQTYDIILLNEALQLENRNRELISYSRAFLANS